MSKEEKTPSYPTNVETRVSLLEQSIGYINQTLIRIENDSKEFRNEIRRDMRSDFRWIVGLMITFSLGLLGVMSKGFHWF